MNELKSEDQGLFIIFLCKVWINENEIKNDDARISRILKISEKKWKALKSKLIASGLLHVSDGFDEYLINNRLTKEMELSKEKSANGLKAARAKNAKFQAAKERKPSNDNSCGEFGDY